MSSQKPNLKQRALRDEMLESRASSALFGETKIMRALTKEEIFDNASLINDSLEVLNCILARFGVESAGVRHCSTVEEMLSITLEPKGIMYSEADLSDRSWKSKTEHMLGFLENGRPVMLYPSIVGYRYLCPETGQHGHVGGSIKLKDRAYVIYRPTPDGKLTRNSFFSFVLGLVSPREWTQILLATLFVTLFGMVAPEINRFVLGPVVEGGAAEYRTLVFLAVLFVSAGLASMLLSMAKQYWVSMTQLRVGKQVQAAVLARTLLLPISFFRANSTGGINSRISNSQVLSNLVITVVFDIVVSIVFSLLFIPQMGSIAPELVGFAVAVLLVQIALSSLAAVSFTDNQRNLIETDAKTSSLIFTTIKGIQKIKTAGAEKRAFAKWAALYRSTLDFQHNPSTIVKLRSLIIPITTSLASAIFIIVAVRSGVSAGDYIAFSASFGFVSAAVARVADLAESFAKITPLVEQLQPIFEDSVVQDDLSEYVKSIRGDISLRNVSLTYGNESAFGIHDVSLDIKSGEKIAFVGPSGSGKSTILRLIIGLEQPTGGTVYFDGKPLETLNQQSLCKQIGSVFQLSRVLPGSVADNVRFGSLGLTDEEVWAALDKARIGDLIRELPQKLDTEISETSGGSFSGGQKQCLLLARAFARNASVLILDEATSALDNITQAGVLESIYATDATVLMVAHRLSTVRNCDRIIVVDGGRIVEQGTYDALMEQGGVFAQLVANQLTS